MSNYVHLDGKQIPLTDSQVERIRVVIGRTIPLAGVAPGEIARIGSREFVVLEHLEDGTTALILKGLYGEREYGDDNNFSGSEVQEACEEFLASLLEEGVAAGNIVEHEVDLTSLDGLKEYGTCRCKVSLLTMEQYRKYVEILDRHKPGKWWWLVTPHSTDTHGNNRWILCVVPSGRLDFHYYDVGVRGVRPFLIFNSSIFVSV